MNNEKIEIIKNYSKLNIDLNLNKKVDYDTYDINKNLI